MNFYYRAFAILFANLIPENGKMANAATTSFDEFMENRSLLFFIQYFDKFSIPISIYCRFEVRSEVIKSMSDRFSNRLLI